MDPDGHPGGDLYNIFREWCARAVGPAKLIDVFYEGQAGLYSKISADEEISAAVAKILLRTGSMAKQCIAFKEDNFAKYSTVWTQSRESFIADLLASGGGMSEPDRITGVQTPKKPELEQFGEQIGSYRKSQGGIRLIRDSHPLGWLRIDCRPLKQSLDLSLGKWVYLFTHHLNNDIVVRRRESQQFLQDAHAGLDVKVKKGDIDQLVAVLEAMLLIRTRAPLYEKLFDRLKATVALLKSHGVTVTDALLLRIDQGPGQWQELKSNWSNVQDKVAPLQQDQTASLRDQEEEFVAKLADLKVEFGREIFYRWEIGYPKAVELMTKWDRILEKVNDDAAEIRANGELLELTVNPFKSLTLMEADLNLLHNVWETAQRISTELQQWRDTLWSEIDVSVLSNECENYLRTIRRIGKRAKDWGVYTGSDQPIKSVSSTIPIMDQLHNDKLRERHWERLETVTAVDFEHSGDLKMGDILEKDVMRFSEDITEIVDSADNEVRMETQLSDLDKTWREMNFRYRPMEECLEIGYEPGRALKLGWRIRISMLFEKGLHCHFNKRSVGEKAPGCNVRVDDMIGDGALLGHRENAMMFAACCEIPWAPIRIIAPLILP
jgi:dynein heavy chain